MNKKRNHAPATTVSFDGEKLRKYLSDKKIKASALSTQMGYQEGYVSKAIYDGKTALASYKLMCLILKVDEDKFLIKEQPKQTKENAPTPTINTANLEKQLADINTKLDTLVDLIRGDTLVSAKMFGDVHKLVDELCAKTESTKKVSENVHVNIQPEQQPPVHMIRR